jgi:hypothetical protein
VKQARQQLLSRPALAENENGRRQPRHFLHEIDDVADEPARTDEEFALPLFRNLRAEGDDLPVQVLPLAGVPDERSELVVVEVLRDVVVGAVLHRLHRGLDLVDRRDHDALGETVVFLDDPEHVEPADARQADVEEDQVDILVFQQRQCRLAARDGQHVVIAFEDRDNGVAHALVVVADQDRLGGCHCGPASDCSAFPLSPFPLVPFPDCLVS